MPSETGSSPSNPPYTDYPECPLARFDWKATSDDMLYAMRDAFAEDHPFFLEQVYDDLSDNLSVESTDDALAAFGQEVTVQGLALVDIDEGNDEYCLALVPFDQQDAFIKDTKKQTGLRATLCKQARKKAGTPAKRVNLSKRLITDEYIMGDNARSSWGERGLDFKAGSRYVLRTHRLYGPEGGGLGVFSSWLDLDTWPPRPYPCSRHLYHYACDGRDGGLWALLASRPELEGTPEEYLPSHRKQQDGFVYLTPNPVDEQTWRGIPFPEGSEPTYSHLFFLDEELFFEQEREVWVLPRTGSLEPEQVTPQSWRKLFTIELPDDWLSYQGYPYPIRTGDGEQFIAAGGTLYSWRDGVCERLPDRHVRRGPTGHTVATDEHEFMYVDDQIRLIALDVRTGAERFRPLRYGTTRSTMHDLGDGWAAFLSNGTTPSDVPIALFWNRHTDEWAPLFRGALGREAIMHIEPYTDGSILLFSYERRLYRVFNLIEQARKLRGKKTVEFGAWSEDPEAGSNTWFSPAMARELGLTDIRRIELLDGDKAMLHAPEGIFWIERADGLWNKVHADRKAERPAHEQRVFGDGSFAYTVYRMLTAEDFEVYRTYPPEAQTGTQAAGVSSPAETAGGEASAPPSQDQAAEPQADPGPELEAEPGPEPEAASARGGLAVRILTCLLLVFAFVYTLIKLLIVRPIAGLIRLLTRPFR